MNTSHLHLHQLWQALLQAWPGLILVIVFVFAVCSGIYMAGANLYNFIKFGNASGRGTSSPKSLHTLWAACVFFAFVGLTGTALGIDSWIVQPLERNQAVKTTLSALFFFGLAFMAYSEIKKSSSK